MLKSPIIYITSLILIVFGSLGCSTENRTASIQIPTPLSETQYGLPDLQGREVKIALENAYLPFNYVLKANQKAGGWDYAAWEIICTRLNCQPVFVPHIWDGMLDGIVNGQFDVAADGITITAERRQQVAFSTAYSTALRRVLVRIDDERIQNLDDLVNDEKLLIGAQAGLASYNSAVKLVGENRVVEFSSGATVLDGLISNKVDALLVPEIAGQGYSGQNADLVRLVGLPVEVQQLAFAFPIQSDLIEPVNQALVSMWHDGTIDQLAADYFSPKFNISYNDIGPGAYGN